MKTNGKLKYRIQTPNGVIGLVQKAYENKVVLRMRNGNVTTVVLKRVPVDE